METLLGFLKPIFLFSLKRENVVKCLFSELDFLCLTPPTYIYETSPSPRRSPSIRESMSILFHFQPASFFPRSSLEKPPTTCIPTSAQVPTYLPTYLRWAACLASPNANPNRPFERCSLGLITWAELLFEHKRTWQRQEENGWSGNIAYTYTMDTHCNPVTLKGAMLSSLINWSSFKLRYLQVKALFNKWVTVYAVLVGMEGGRFGR